MSMSEIKTIYDLKLHETIVFDEPSIFTTILRVPGGWFYRSFDKSYHIMSGCFVPFDNEFQAKGQNINAS